MKIGNLNIWKECTSHPSIVFRVDGSADILRCGYEELAGILFVLRGMSESENGNRYRIQNTHNPFLSSTSDGYLIEFGDVRHSLTHKDAFILMLALEGAIKNAI